MTPDLLLSLDRRVSAAEALLRGMGDEYLVAVVQGRLAEWGAAMRSIVTLLECDSELPRAKRATISSAGEAQS